jgi:ABC-type transport system involved in multi-copper enzyme maturation permease subunit
MAATAQVAGPRHSGLADRPHRASFGSALRSEFTKLRSVRSTYWTLLILALVTVGLGVVACAGAASHANEIGRAGFDPVRQSLGGLYLSQLVITVIGALTITSEYSTGMIRTSLTVHPRRGAVFAAKALVFAAVSLVVGLIVCFGSFFIGQAILSGHHLSVSLSDPGVLRAVIGGGLFLALCGMLAFGLGAIMRHTAAAITAAVGLLFVLSILVNFLPQSWQIHVDKWMPAIAGSQGWVTKSSPGDHLLGPWAGLGVLGLYAAVALVIGLILFRRRDA